MNLKTKLEGQPDVWATINRLRIRDIGVLAPKVQEATRCGLKACEGQKMTLRLQDGTLVVLDLDVMVEETGRNNDLQQIYYQQGTTNAPTAEKSWHFYRLAIDVISKKYGWFDGAAAREAWPDGKVREQVCEAWFRAVAAKFEPCGFHWGGWWHHPDLPHFQWHECAVSPHEAPTIYGRGGFEAVWRAVGAM